MSDLIRRYEAGKKEAKHLIREVCQLCLQGFRETLSSAGISLDSWDWESDFIWNQDVIHVLDKLKATPYVFQEAGVLEFDAEKVDVIIAEGIPTRGLGLAVMNRLRRASGYNIVKVD